MNQPLAGIRVVELSTGVAGAMAAKLLADFGADVVKVEPPVGDPIRTVGPFPDDRPGDPEQGALHLHLDTNKRSVVLDARTAGGAAAVLALAAGADAVIESSRPTGELWHRVGPAALRAAGPDLVITSVTPFGQTGPYAAFRGEDIVTYAMAGPMSSTGIREREPVKLAGRQTHCQGGAMAALATVAALAMAGSGTGGVHVDLSLLECQAASIDRRTTYLLHYQWSGAPVPRASRLTQRQLPVGMYPTLDGHVQIITVPTWVPGMLATLGDAELAERFRSPGWMSDPSLPDAIDAVLYPWLLSRGRRDASAEAQARHWAVTPLNAPIDVVDDDHFTSRGYFLTVDHPVAGPVRQPGPPFRLGDAWAIRRPAPLLDQHGAEVAAELAQAPVRPRRDDPPPPPARLPLEGIRVLDLTVVWAGPAVTMHLADLGAEVIRVDNPFVFPTATRGGTPRPPAHLVPELGPLGSYPGMDPGPRPWNRHGMFAAHARSKLSCTLDLRTDLGRDAFLRLVDRSDVFVENNSVTVIDKLGIGWDVLHARNPRLLVLRMPPMGLDGPYSTWLGFGAHFESLCGMTALRGYPDEEPDTLMPVFHMDPASGTAGALAVLLALRRRAATGLGELVELPQSENMLQHVGEYLIDAARSGRRHTSLGNRHERRAPQGCYPCVGDDRWAVISVGSDEEWRALVTAMGTPAWAGDTRFATVEGRILHHDELDAGIAVWTAGRTAAEVFAAGQAHGVPCGPVHDEADLLADPHLAARGFFRPQGSVDLGTWRFPGHAWRWDGPAMRYGPINRLGADNEYVLREVAGLDDVGYEALVAAGQISLDYLDADGAPL